jgi:transmembrane sensor
MMPSDFDSHPVADPYDWDALARYVAGECTPAEERALRAWLDERPARAQLVDALRHSIDGLASGASDVDVERALERVHARMAEPEAAALAAPARPRRQLVGQRVPRTRSVRWPVIATLAAAALVVATVGIRNARRHDTIAAVATVTAASYTTGIGGRDSVWLPDGTRIVLGPSSRLDVGADYGRTARTVELHGDGYFDVVHDATRPFTVHSGAATIVDVGTTFTVHDANGSVRVAVTSGSVRLSAAARGDSGVLLAAGDVATLVDSGTALVARGAGTDDEAAFTRGRLVFRDAPLADVVVEMRRWYGVELRVGDSAVARRRLTATFEGETPEQAMTIIGAALGARIERRGDTVFVR